MKGEYVVKVRGHQRAKHDAEIPNSKHKLFVMYLVVMDKVQNKQKFLPFCSARLLGLGILLLDFFSSVTQHWLLGLWPFIPD